MWLHRRSASLPRTLNFLLARPGYRAQRRLLRSRTAAYSIMLASAGVLSVTLTAYAQGYARQAQESSPIAPLPLEQNKPGENRTRTHR